MSSVLGFLGNEETNAANSEQAQRQMDFQERMSNTAHQREVKDLIAAGINPMMTAMKGGATTPSGAQATMTNSMAAGVTSASQAAMIENTKAQTDQVKAQTELIRSQIPEAAQRIATGASSAGHLDAMRDNIRQEMTAFDQRVKKLIEDTKLTEIQQHERYEAGWKHQTGQLVDKARVHEIAAHAAKLRVEAELLGLKVPEAVQEASFWKGPDGRPAIYFRHAPKNLTSAFTGSIGAIADDLRGLKPPKTVEGESRMYDLWRKSR